MNNEAAVSLDNTAGRCVDGPALDHINARLQAAAQAPWLHVEVGRRMAERLSWIRKKPQRVLDWWSHTGGSIDLLRHAYPDADLQRVEPTVPGGSRASGASASAPAPWWSPSRWRPSAPQALTAAQLQPEATELLWANMALHRCLQPQAALREWQRALSVDGFLMFSTLGTASLQELQGLYRKAGWPAPFSPFVDMHDLGDMLVESGFADPVMDQESLTLTWPSPETALAELRLLGGNAHPQRTPGLRSRSWLRGLSERLRDQADAQGRVALSFEIVYGHAFKPLPKARVAAVTQVSVDDFKRMTRAQKP